jgi:hypothetical protein
MAAAGIQLRAMVDHLGHIVEATTREYSSAPSTPCASA